MAILPHVDGLVLTARWGFANTTHFSRSIDTIPLQQVSSRERASSGRSLRKTYRRHQTERVLVCNLTTSGIRFPYGISLSRVQLPVVLSLLSAALCTSPSVLLFQNSVSHATVSVGSNLPSQISSNSAKTCCHSVVARATCVGLLFMPVRYQSGRVLNTIITAPYF
jgi:hypothetical protein